MKKRAWFLLILASVLWSTSFPIIKVGLEYVTPVELVFLRFFFAGTIGSVILFRIKGSSAIKILKDKSIIGLGTLNALGFYLQFMGQAYTLAAKAALLVNMYVVFVGFAGYWILGEKPKMYHIFVLILALVGAGFTTIGPHGLHEILNVKGFKGDLLILGSAFVWAFYIVFSRKIAMHYNPTVIMGGVMFWTMTPLFILYLIMNKGLETPIDAVLIGFYLAIFCSVVPYTLYVHSLREITAFSSSIVLLLEIVLAVIWSFLFLGERFKLVEIIGGALLSCAILLLILYETGAFTRLGRRF